ncbi:MAG: hypothetical protein JNK29_04855 [Anaerolineales bacterium]|nr:hypothetical protein [Anaerolineales bacterium]
MPRKSLFGTHQRPVLSGAHGGTVHHDPFESLVSHRLAWEIVFGTLAVVLTILLALLMVAGLQTYARQRAPAVLDAYYHYYDGVEAVRAARLINRPAADRSYDAIEDLRAARLVNAPAADRGYDAIEDLRAARLVNPPLVADRSYDAIEEIRANRDLGE